VIPYLPAIAGMLLAADAAPVIDDEPLDEVTVMATRRATQTDKISAAVSSIDGEQSPGRKLTTDALRSLAGVSLQQTTPGQGAAIIRGLKGSAVLHLVDGVRLSNAMFRTAPTPWFALVPTSSVKRLEVIRGTPASLYGSEAVGGVVQSVSRLPDFDSDVIEYAGDLVVAFDSAELQKSIRATLDAGNRDLAASISAEYLQTGDRRVGDGNRIGPSAYSSKAVRAVLHGTPSESRSWFVDLHYLEQPATPRIDELVPGFGQTEPSSSEFLFAPNRRVFAHLQHDLVTDSGLDWKIDAAWQRIDDDRVTRDFGADERRFEKNRSDLYGLTVNASGIRGNLSWIAGADLYYDEVRSGRVQESLSGGVSTALAPRFPDGSTIFQGGVFSNVEWPVSERHRVSAGLRYSDVRIELPDGTSISPGRLSGDLGWIFDGGDSWQLVANIGSGFRAPNIADLGTLGNRPGNRFNTPNSGLAAETVTHADVGVRRQADTWRFEIMLFALRYKDRVVSVSTGGVTPEGRDVVQSVNASSSSIHGVEAGLGVDISARLSLSALLNFTRGEQLVAGIDEAADRIPPLNGRAALRFEHSERWLFEVWLVAAGHQDRLSARDVRDVRIDPDGTPGWASVGGNVAYTNDTGWRFILGVDNWFDKRFRTHGSGIDAPGRNVSLLLQRQW